MPLPPAPARRADQLPPEAFAAAAQRPVKKVAAVAKPEKTAARAQRPAPAQAAKAAPSPASAPQPVAKTQNKAAQPGAKKLFVLDTNVLLHDPSSLFRFAEHDVYVPLVVLEELDAHKKGSSEVARNARQVSRSLDALLAAVPPQTRLEAGLPLAASGQHAARGMLHLQGAPLTAALPALARSNDNQILATVAALRGHIADRTVVLVSKDINMRVKARALALHAEDYQNDKVLDDGDVLYSGCLALAPDFWGSGGPDSGQKGGHDVQSWHEGALACWRVAAAGHPWAAQLLVNQFVYCEEAGRDALYLRVSEVQGSGKNAVVTLKTIRDFAHPRHAVWGVGARNREQNFALNLLMNPDVDLVTLAGTAGSGKTLLALAAALVQVLDERRYGEIIMTRATVSVGEDIGFLPGTEEEKMQPWMGALDDNLEFLARCGSGGSTGEWGRAAANDLIRSRIKIKSMSFMRGRTFMDKFVIIDEAQNLTPKQIKTLITRAGPGSKIVCLGNLAQIDTPYLTEGASGLAWVVDRCKGWAHSGHVTLARGERSRLADFAAEVL